VCLLLFFDGTLEGRRGNIMRACTNTCKYMRIFWTEQKDHGVECCAQVLFHGGKEIVSIGNSEYEGYYIWSASNYAG
jgi:hypothetical protein